MLINPDDYEDFLVQVGRHVDLSKVRSIPHRKESDDYLAGLRGASAWRSAG